MTVSTDLQRHHGTRQRLYLKIDGLRERIWQDDGTGSTPARYDASYSEDWPTSSNWVEDAHNGTITPGAGTVRFQVSGGVNAKWDEANDLAPMYQIAIADLGLSDTSTLLIFETTLSAFPTGSAWEAAGLFLWEDDNNALRLDCTTAAVCTRKSRASGTWSYGTGTDVGSLPVVLQIAWNNGSGAVTTPDQGVTLAAGEYAMFASADGGATWSTIQAAAAMPCAPTVVGVFCANAAASGAAAIDCTLTGFTVLAPQLDTDRVGLLPPSELSMSLDITTMKAEAGAMTFEMLDLPDTDGASWWGKRIAPAAWDAVNKHWRINVGSAPHTYVDANADTIPLKDSTGLPASGTIYIGQETASYASHATNVISGVNKGLYPIIGSTYGQTYLRPEETDAQYQMHVGSVPFTWHGRRVGLYLTTYDTATETWNDPGELMWVGRISNTIQYSPKKKLWKLSCESILADLEREVCTNLHKTHVKGINITGSKGRKFTVLRDYSGVISGDTTIRYECTVAAGWYPTHASLAAAVKSALDSMTLVGGSTAGTLTLPMWRVVQWGKKYVISGVYATPNFPSKWTIKPRAAKDSFDLCHALCALGFSITTSVKSDESIDGVYSVVEFDAEKEPAEAYHPINQTFNGNALYVVDGMQFVPNQGDDSTDGAFISGSYKDSDDEDTVYVEKYTARSSSSSYDKLTLTASSQTLPYSPWGYIARRVGDDSNSNEIRQAYKPIYTTTGGTSRGPFEALLYLLLSTGTANYNNSTYDKLPLSYGLGVQSSLVDIDSFLSIDKELAMSPLVSSRDDYIIEKAAPWMELVGRECVLFGCAVVFNRGKIRLKDVTYPSRLFADVTIDESCRAGRTEAPDTDMPVDTVVNSYKIKLADDTEVGISDADSVAMFGAKSIEIDSERFQFQSYASGVQALVSQTLLGRPYRFPSPIVEVTLAPYLINRIYPGDVVLYTSSTTPDPAGSGSFSVSEYALVIDSAWNYKTKVGHATLMLLTNYSNVGLPWSPSALVTAYASNVITLDANEFGAAGDPDDGTAFSSGDAVLIVERSPADPASPQSWSTTLSDDYGDAGSQQFTVADALTGYDATKQYVMVFADYPSVVLAQRMLGTWQASSVTELINGNVRAYRYG